MKPGGFQKGFLLNPYLWLGFVIMLALAGFTGYRQGVKVTKADYEQAANEAMTAMITRHNEQAEADRKSAVKAEEARQKARINRLEKRHALDLEAARNHRPECSWTDIEQRLLNDLIDSANGKETAPGGVPDGLRPPAATDGKDGSGGQGLGRKRGFKLWRMSIEARGMRGLGGALNKSVVRTLSIHHRWPM